MLTTDFFWAPGRLGLGLVDAGVLEGADALDGVPVLLGPLLVVIDCEGATTTVLLAELPALLWPAVELATTPGLDPPALPLP